MYGDLLTFRAIPISLPYTMVGCCQMVTFFINGLVRKPHLIWMLLVQYMKKHGELSSDESEFSDCSSDSEPDDEH